MASTAGEAPSTGFDALQTRAMGYGQRILQRLEHGLEAERGQLPLWLPVLLGLGIAGWFVFPLRPMWWALILGGGSIALLGVVLGPARRLGLSLILGGCALALGCGLIWIRATQQAGPVLTRPQVTQVTGVLISAQPLIARDAWRLVVAPDAALNLPRRVRISVPIDAMDKAPMAGTRLLVKARLAPPPGPVLPGGFDFRRQAWFGGLGAVGKALGPVRWSGSRPADGLRDRVNGRIAAHLPDPARGIAMALATGDEGQIAEADQAAMRASGLAHLLSVSGLHISAVMGAAFVLTRLLLALSPALALRVPVLFAAGAAAAMTGIGYTLLTGAQVPTIRSCIAALLILIGMALGREAMTLRLVAAAALAVLLVWPEALMGPSFQLSFAAITAIVALHDSRSVQAWVAPRDEAWGHRLWRSLAGLLLTGLAVEVALAPIALFHFHKAGLYGALANLVAIPLTTFVIMPAEALALLLDILGLGAPFWWITGHGIAALLWLAHQVAALPGAVAVLPIMPMGAFALMLCGGLWLLLWRTRVRVLGLAALAAGMVWALVLPAPDLLITGDGRHVAVRDDRGGWAILRPRAGGFVRQALAERAGYAADLADLDSADRAHCSPDACVITLDRAGRSWTLLAIRSRDHLRWADLVSACQRADILVSARRLPRACAARWLTLDPQFLAKTGGLAVHLNPAGAAMVHPRRDDHPWAIAPSSP